MVPVEILSLKQDVGDDGEHTETDALLDDLELHKIEKPMTAIRGQFWLAPDCCNFRCPYQASVMKTLLVMSRMIV